MQRILQLTIPGLLWLAAATAAQDAPAFKVVVQAANPVDSLTRAQVSQLLLKKTTRWTDGSKALPVDQLKKSALRQAFSQEIHGKDVRAIEAYWQGLIFTGRGTPPPELASDAEVLSYVSSKSAAIGYVSKAATLGDGVKVVTITD